MAPKFRFRAKWPTVNGYTQRYSRPQNYLTLKNNAPNYWLYLGVRTCETHGWHKITAKQQLTNKENLVRFLHRGKLNPNSNETKGLTLRYLSRLETRAEGLFRAFCFERPISWFTFTWYCYAKRTHLLNNGETARRVWRVQFSCKVYN